MQSTEVMEEFDKELEYLLVNKPFNNLLPVEKAYVLQKLTEEEYSKYHFLLTSAAAMAPLAGPDLVIQKNLAKAFKAKHKRPVFNFGLLKHDLWSFSIGRLTLAVMCLLVAGYLLYQPEQQVKNKRVVQVTPVRPAKEQPDEPKAMPPQSVIAVIKETPAKHRKIIREQKIAVSNPILNNATETPAEIPATAIPDTGALGLTVSAMPIGLGLDPQYFLTLGIDAQVPGI